MCLQRVKRTQFSVRSWSDEMGSGDMEIQEAGEGESRRQAASVCSRTGGRRKAE